MVTRKTRRLVTRAALWGATGLLAAALLYLSASTYRVYTRMVEVEAMRVLAEAERDALTARNEELSASLRSLNTPRGVEAEIRARYPLVKPGEVEFVLVGNASGTVVDTSSSTRDSIWTAIIGWFSERD